MGRRGLSFTFISVLTFGAFLLLQPFVASKEFRREVTCYNDILHLDCGKSFLAIHEAYFTTASQENQTCHSPVPEHDYIEDEDAVTESANYSICYEDIRIYLNRKCSGFKNCNYSYFQQPERICSNPEGLSVVRFDCVRESNVNKFCNSKVPSPEGYIASPGYPQYYPQLNECSWTLTANEGQTIFAKVLHLHLREATDITPTMSDHDAIYAMGIRGQPMSEQISRCDDDRLTVMEGIVKKFSVCGENLEALRSVEVDGSAGMELRFKSAGFLPASGFLAYFKIQGCPTLPASEGIYLSERNESAAVYACNNNQVFNDTLESKRFLKCIRDHHWNDTLPPCTSVEDITTTTTTSMHPDNSIEEEFKNISMAAIEKVNPKAALISDIIIPSVIIGVILIVNGVILAVIFAFRRRQKPVTDEFPDLTPEHVPQQLVAEEANEPLPDPLVSEEAKAD